jgi:hypothetical protein
MGYFKEVNFIFLVVGHTKNAPNKQNLFTFQDLVQTLIKLTSVTIHPAVLEDFLNFDKLLNGLF